MSDTQKISLKGWLILISMGILVFLMNIDYTAVNLVLVPVSIDLNEDINNLQWLMSVYVLVWGAFVIPFGRIADIYGQRNTLFVGLIIFIIGSCITGLGHSLGTMIFGRIVQGLGASIFTAPVWALIFTSAPPKKQGFVMGVVLSFAGLGLATGPTLSGYIIEVFNWRWIFYINIPIGIIVVVILLLFCKNNKTESAAKVDLEGSLLLASGLCSLVFALNQIEIWGCHDYRLWSFFGLSFVLLALFFMRDRHKQFRMIPSSLIRNKFFIVSLSTVFLMSMVFSLVLVMMVLYLQSVQKYSSYETGLIFFSMTISMGLLSPFGGQLVDKFGVKVPMIFSALLTGIGTLLMAHLEVSSPLYWSIMSLFCAGTGIGIYFTAGNIAMMRSVPEKDLNVASGVYTMGMMMGNTLSIIFSTSLLVSFGRVELFRKLGQNKIALTDLQYSELAETITKVEHTPNQLSAFSSDQIPSLLNWIDQAFVFGFSKNMILGSLAAAFITIIIFWGMRSSHSKEKL